MEAGNVYRVIISKNCEKNIYKAPPHIRKAVDNAFKELSSNPYSHPRVKQLRGEWEGYLRYRIGNYRLIYRVDDTQIIVYAIDFGSRGDIYK